MTSYQDNIKIIAETKQYIVVYKPAGLPVQTRSLTVKSLEDVLRSEDKKRDYLAPINRLDQPVEGLVLFAKDKKTAAELSKQLNEHTLRKEYMAVVDAVPAEKKKLLTDQLLKDAKTNMSRVVSKATPASKEAVLEYECISSDKDSSLLYLKLYTGRHHQIRVQLSNAGLPITADRKYNGKSSKYAFPALCSCALIFKDPKTKEERSYRIEPLGEAFEKFR